jgi:hypothetical protein
MSLTELAARMAEQHRPVKKDFWDAAVPGYYLVKCQACDGNRLSVWKPGDPEIECDIWVEAVALGVVKK